MNKNKVITYIAYILTFVWTLPLVSHAAVPLSSLLSPGASLQIGDKVFTNFTWTSTAFAASGINVATVGDGSDSNLYGIEISGAFTVVLSPATAKTGVLTYSVQTTGNYLVSDIHQTVTASGAGQMSATVLESASPNPSGTPVVAQSTVGISSSAGSDFTDPPGESSDILVLPVPLQKVWISKLITIVVSNTTSRASISDIQQRFSQVQSSVSLPPPMCLVSPDAAQICAGNTQSFTNMPAGGTPPFTIAWTGPGGFTSNDFVITVALPGTYIATITDALGATNTCSANLIVASTPDATITVPSVVCAGGSGYTASVANAGLGASYVWTVSNGTITSGQGTPAIAWTAGSSGSAVVSVTVTSIKNCPAADSKNITITPNPGCTIFGDNDVCGGSTNTYTSSADPGASHSWSIIGDGTIDGSLTANAVSVIASASGMFMLHDSLVLDGCTGGCDKLVTVNTNPVCSITGNASVCPASLNTYTAPPGATSYSWTISGNGEIQGDTNAQSVLVTAGTLCSTPFTLSLSLTNASGCSSTCGTIVSVEDTTPPTITHVPDGGDLGCNPPAPTDDSVKSHVTASDDCGNVAIIVTHSDGGTPCAPIRTFTIRAKDACGNLSPSKTVTYSWKADVMPPLITTVPAGGDLGCNPTSVPDDSFVIAGVVASDDCGSAVVQVSHVDGGTPCAPMRTFTITAQDGCGNPAVPQTVTYTWKVDTTPPTISHVPDGRDLGCNPQSIPDDNSIQSAVQATDNCSSAPVICVTHADVTTGCTVTRTFTIIGKDDCQNPSSPSTVTFTWTADTTKPVITSVPSGSDLGCNPATPPNDSSIAAQVQASDDCSLAATNVTHVDSTNGCSVTRTFAITATDGCGNTSPSTNVTFTWTADLTPPTITCPGNVDLTNAPSGKAACSVTQGGWGAPPHGGNPGAILAANFSTAYPGGSVNIGNPVGYTLTFSSASAIQGFLPQGGTPGALTASSTNPKSSAAGVFAGQVLALQLNVDFGDKAVTGMGSPVGSLVFNNASSPLNGKTVSQILALANTALGGGGLPAGMTFSSLNDLCDNINSSFDGCVADAFASTYLVAPPATLLPPSPAQTGTATATDNCTAAPVVTFADVVTPGSCPGSASIARTWTAIDACGNSAKCVQTITLNCPLAPPLQLSCSGGSGQVNVSFSSLLLVSGGTAPYTFSINSGALPPGLALNPTNGTISGTPTTAGSFSFSAQVKDSKGLLAYSICNAGCAGGQCTITVSPAQLVLGCAGGSGQVGIPYSAALAVSGGTPPYTFAVISGSLPSGLNLDTNSGAITGIPATAGTLSFTAQVQDSTGLTATESAPCKIVIGPGSPLASGDTATIGFWHNKNGQALINSLNGGPTSTALGNWLAGNFPYLYDAGSGNNLAGKPNSAIASLFLTYFNVNGAKTQAQLLAAALAAYVTDSALAGNNAGTYGFNISATGTGAKTYNVQSNGTGIGLSNNTSYTVMALLQQANVDTQNGTFNAAATYFNAIFDGINSTGDIK